MYLRIVLPALAVTLASGCKSVDCGPGTAEKNGSCVPSSETVGTAKCGPFTELHGDTCVPRFSPTTLQSGHTPPHTHARYRVTDVNASGTMFVALAVDDAAPANRGIAGTTNPAGVAAPTALGAATKDLELFVVRQSTITAWGAKPTLASGIYAPIYRGHRTGTALAPNVHFTFGPRTSPPPTMTDASRTFYFGASATARMTLDNTATATGVNGTALVNCANLNEIYSGNGGLSSAMCTGEIHAGGAVPGVVFVQIFRPTDIPSMTCPL